MADINKDVDKCDIIDDIKTEMATKKSSERISSKKTIDSPNDSINENSEGGSGGSNWWGSWINTAKSKSVSVLEAVKRDLDEISTAVRSEVSNAGTVLNETLRFDEPESTANTVKRSFSSFLGQVSEALAPSFDDDETETVKITADGVVTLTGFQKHLAELQTNEATYLAPPDDTLAENYQRWLEIVEQDQFTQQQIERHLNSSEILKEHYLRLVPDTVSHMDFWKRYLFKRALLEDALANAEIAERRAKAEMKTTNTVSAKRAGEIIQTEQPKSVVTEIKKDLQTKNDEVSDDGDIKWDAEEFGHDEISEEDQERLLQEYEAEIQQREKRKSQIIPIEEKIENDKKNAAQLQEKTQQTLKDQKKSQQKKPVNASSTNPSKKPTNQKPNENVKAKSTTKSISNNSNDKRKLNDKTKSQLKSTTSEPKSLAEDLKTDTGAASDESWEKDFDLSDRDQ